MADVLFEDYTIKVQKAIDDRINVALEECAGELESAVKRESDRTRRTGQTSSGWAHHVDDAAHEATIGNPLENAIWEEFGTGEHALNNDGREGGWAYQDEKGDWHFTHGKKPRRAFYKAFTSTKKAIINRIQESMRGL